MMPPRWLRRVLLPVTLLIELVLAWVFGVVALVAAALSPLTHRRRAMRIAGFGANYLMTDMASVGVCGWLWVRRLTARDEAAWWEDAHYDLLRWALGRALRDAGDLFAFRVDVSEPEGAAAMAGDGPVLVLSRHGGPGDSFVVVHTLIERYARRPRIVLKEILALDPALDLILSRLSCVFLPTRHRSGEDLPERLATMAEAMMDRDALLVFPEGGNWTPGRRTRAIAKLRARGKRRAARSAERMPHVMPPRPAGVLACLDARPDARVVVVAHTGLEEITSVGTGWHALPLRRPMRLSWWEAGRSHLPEGEEKRTEWLQDQWGRVEEWITDHPNRQPLTW